MTFSLWCLKAQCGSADHYHHHRINLVNPNIGKWASAKQTSLYLTFILAETVHPSAATQSQAACCPLAAHHHEQNAPCMGQPAVGIGPVRDSFHIEQPHLAQQIEAPVHVECSHSVYLLTVLDIQAFLTISQRMWKSILIVNLMWGG